MTEPKNKQLYSKVKAEADEVFKKPSAYKSGWIVREYKKRGGKYLGSKKQDGLTRWFKEEWDDIGGKDYPVYRPTKRITKDTPLTASEIDPKQAKKQIALKQVIKGDKNLPKFQKKIGGYSIMSDDIDYDKLKWGSFTKQFNASKKKLGVKDLGEFADHIISNPKKFAKKTLQRANFYKNVIKGGMPKRKREAGEAGDSKKEESDDEEIVDIMSGNYARRLEEREREARRRQLTFPPPFPLLFEEKKDDEEEKKEGKGYDAGAYPAKDPDDVYAEISYGGSLIPTDGFNERWAAPHSSRFLPMYM